MSEWRPIETAPKDGTEVLVWNGQLMDVRIQGGSVDPMAAWWMEPPPSHWMPLPPPPVDGDGGAQ